MPNEQQEDAEGAQKADLVMESMLGIMWVTYFVFVGCMLYIYQMDHAHSSCFTPSW